MSEVGEDILRGLEEAVAWAKGDKSKGELVTIEVPEKIDVKAIRKKLGMSQTRFATQFGFDIWAVRNWEQGRRVPDRSARVLLKVIDHNPQTVVEALAT